MSMSDHRYMFHLHCAYWSSFWNIPGSSSGCFFINNRRLGVMSCSSVVEKYWHGEGSLCGLLLLPIHITLFFYHSSVILCCSSIDCKEKYSLQIWFFLCGSKIGAPKKAKDPLFSLLYKCAFDFWLLYSPAQLKLGSNNNGPIIDNCPFLQISWYCIQTDLSAQCLCVLLL